MAKPRKLQCLAEASLGNFEKGLVAELAVQVMPMQALQHRFCQHAKAPDLSQMIAGAIPHVHPGGAVHCSAMSEVHFRKPGLLQTGELTTELYVVCDWPGGGGSCGGASLWQLNPGRSFLRAATHRNAARWAEERHNENPEQLEAFCGVRLPSRGGFGRVFDSFASFRPS